VDGNRRITIFKQDDLNVWAVFTDMLIKKDWKDFASDPGTIGNDTTKSTR
jgi:hypothetical protein